jgi:hypothetical protein
MNRASPPRPRVVLHVGSPKTGTTFLQNVLWAHKARAAEQGLLLPLERFSDHYLASLDARGLAGRPEHPPRAVGSWQRLVDETASWPGTVLVSHELLAAATPGEARRAVASFGEHAEVHVVVTARDLLRQMTAEWQEHVKHRSTKTFGEFVAELRQDGRRRNWFWRVQDFAGVLERWGSDLPASQVHVVTVPPVGAPPEQLWTRFAGLLDIDPDTFDTDVSRSNTSLGLEQAELLRRVNIELGERLPLPGPYPTVVKNVLAHRILASHKGTRLSLTPEDTEFAIQESRAVAERLAELGVDVVGSLDELVPDPETSQESANAAAYDPPPAEALLEESVAAVADLLVALRGAQVRHTELVAEVERSPLRFALVRMSERRPVLRRARRVYQLRHAVRDRLARG